MSKDLSSSDTSKKGEGVADRSATKTAGTNGDSKKSGEATGTPKTPPPA